MNNRYVKESPLKQGANEQIAYVLDTTNIGGVDSAWSVSIYDEKGVDKSSTCLSGSVSVSTVYITSPLVKSLTANQVYSLKFQWVYSGLTYEYVLKIYCEE